MLISIIQEMSIKNAEKFPSVIKFHEEFMNVASCDGKKMWNLLCRYSVLSAMVTSFNFSQAPSRNFSNYNTRWSYSNFFHSEYFHTRRKIFLSLVSIRFFCTSHHRLDFSFTFRSVRNHSRDRFEVS
jgi:hypothetical protein